jgi:Putative zinc-finger
VNCQKALELMGEHVDDNLGFRDRWRLRLHIWICRICRRYLSSYRSAIRIAKSIDAGRSDSRNERIPDSLVTSILDSKKMTNAKSSESS